MEKELISINVKRLSDSAKIPTYAHIGDAGADLYASEDFVLPAKSNWAVPTGIAMEIPEGYVGYINPRSGMAMKGITVMNAPGTIDSGYRGEIKVILANHTDKDYQINYLDKIAQIVFHKYHEVFFEPVDELSNSERGHGGFGSSGK
jgi:dUTP pyrophosphatase